MNSNSEKKSRSIQGSKLYELLQLLTSKQENRFREFLASPYWNKEPEALQLFELLSNKNNRKILHQGRQALSRHLSPPPPFSG